VANTIIQTTTELAEKAVAKFELELVDVEFVLENKKRYLRVYIYKKGGITLEDCTKVHKEINMYIDDEIEYEDEYTLEVSSPGYNRPLKVAKDFERYMGEKIIVKFYAPIDGKKEATGSLLKFKDGVVTILVDNEQVEFEVSKTSKINRVFEY